MVNIFWLCRPYGAFSNELGHCSGKGAIDNTWRGGAGFQSNRWGARACWLLPWTDRLQLVPPVPREERDGTGWETVPSSGPLLELAMWWRGKHLESGRTAFGSRFLPVYLWDREKSAIPEIWFDVHHGTTMFTLRVITSIAWEVECEHFLWHGGELWC